MKQLPPLSGLQAFEATAKYSSFTRAAVELGITQAAVSQRVRNLEELIGAKLFIRDGNSVKLTEAAEDFLSSVRRIFGELRLATERLGHYDRGDVLCVACTGSFSIKCLIPLLPKFRAKYPDINIKIRKLSSLDHERSGYDIAIQYGKGDLAGKRVERVCREEVFPVCSPALVKTPEGVRTPADLSRHTIIRVVSPVFTWDEWPRWLDAAGYPDTRITQELFCDVFFPSLQAAIAGLGIVMGRNILVKQDIDAGLLLEPFSTRLTTNSGYYLSLSATAERERRPAVTAFRDWLLETVQEAMAEKPPRALRLRSIAS
jgi:LysR family glycine cleavage system transcriptional activator